MKKPLPSPREPSVAWALAGTVALAVFTGQHAPRIAVSAVVHGAVLTVGALALWIGMLCALGVPRTGAPAPASYRQLGAAFRAALERGARQGWLAALALLFLPFMGLLEPPQRADGICQLLGMTVMCLGLAEARVLRAAVGGGEPAPVPAAARRFRVLAPAELCSLLFCLCASGWFVVVAARATGSADNDAAYYFGVARHIARVGRFEEPIVWHYLVPPATVLHSPFDYWQGLTSLLLLPSMFLFGATSHVALLTMALLSGIALLLLWYLVVIAAPLRHQLAQYVALMTFAMTPAMKTYRFDTESVPVFHMVLLAALVAFALRRLVLSVCLAFLLYLTRGDGAILCAMIWLACLLVSLDDEHRSSQRRWLTLLLTMCLVALAHVALCTWVYDTPTPPAARVAASVSSYFDLFRVTPSGEPVPWLTRVTPTSLGSAFGRAWSNLQTIPFLPQQLVFCALVLAMGWQRPRWPLAGLVWCLLLVGSGLVSAATSVVFAPHRTLYTMVPLVVLVAAVALDQLLDNIDWQRGPTRWVGSLLAAIVVLCIGAGLGELRPYALRGRPLKGLERDVRALDRVLHGAVVASTSPWSVIAVSDSPSVMIPEADEATLEAVFRKYDVKWMLLSSQPCLGRAVPICSALRKGSKTSIGKLAVLQRIHRGSILALRLGPKPVSPPTPRPPQQPAAAVPQGAAPAAIKAAK